MPGVVQAENYDTGGQGVAYNATSTNGTGNSYRSDGIDLEATSDTGGGYDLGWTSGGQWFRYTVNAATAGTYTVSLRVAAPSAVTDALHLSSASGANLSGNVSIPATGGWQNWTTVTATVAVGGRPADPRRRPGQRRLEPQLHVLRRQRRHQLAADGVAGQPVVRQRARSGRPARPRR